MRRFMIFMVALLLANAAFSQDLLVKRNGEQMRVKVLKITKKKVQYVRHGTELPVYTLPISDIQYIEYPMGDRDTFGRAVAAPAKQEPTKWHGSVPTPNGKVAEEYKPAPKEPEKWHGPVPGPDGSLSVEYIPKKAEKEIIYNVGDIYDKDGVRGIVAVLYDGGRHGLVMSLDEACLSWCTLHRKKIKKTGATDRIDGEANMKAVEKYIAENGYSWSDFPAFEWCRAKGEGWFLPSINELWGAGTMYLGGSRTAGSRRFRKNYNANIVGAGGTPLSNIMIYHSSTEDTKDPRYSYYSHMNSEEPHTQTGYKADDLFVRAFHKF